MMSMDEFARITPVKPPTVNKKTNPSDQSIAASKEICAPSRVASHLKIFTPVGMAMIIVAAVK